MSSEPPKLSFMDHIRELRRRLLISVIAIFIGAVVCFIFYNWIFTLLEYPAQNFNFTSIDMTERASAVMMVTVAGGIILAMPVIVYEVIMFVAPALTPREKRWVLLIVPWIFLMFIGGVVFGFMVLAPWTMKFLYNFGSGVASFFPRISSYVSFLTKLVLMVGFLFEMPVITTFLARIRILKPEWLVRRRPIAVILAFVIGAILTPPDPVTQTILALPLLILYEMSIFLAKRVYPKPKEEELEVEAGEA
jgi:sec-independent protein translocase protein TatC